MLLVAAISIAGMSVAFPVGIGLALVVGVVWNFALKPTGNPAFLFTGAAIIVGAIVVDALAYRSYAAEKLIAAARSGRTRSTRITVSPKGIVLALVSGLLMGSFFPLVEMAKVGENGLGPYAVGAIFALGVLFSTFVFNLFFMNLPVKGEPIDLAQYFKPRFKYHLWGIIGGMIWYSGAIANFVAASAEGPAQVGPAVSYAIGQGATMISALWGLLVWKEFAGADSKVRAYLRLMFILFLCGLGLVSTAPLVAR